MDFITACQRLEGAQAGYLVMAELDPAIYVFASKERKQDVDHRDKPGDDAAMRSCSITSVSGILDHPLSRVMTRRNQS
jgi:hypothetical protein